MSGAPAAGVSSNSQNGQDNWVASLFSWKRGGFFLEIGAGDGIWISNTLNLEKHYGWTGILVEPTSAFERLVTNRPHAVCVNACVASDEKQVTLVEISDLGQLAIDQDRARGNTLLSVVSDDLAVSDAEQANLLGGSVQSAKRVVTRSLAAILDEHNAPRIIDYFSLDVEGYEHEILRNFPFERYAFRCLGIERPPAALHDLLAAHGYVIRARLGQDAMYVNPRAMGFRFRIVERSSRAKSRLRTLARRALGKRDAG